MSNVYPAPALRDLSEKEWQAQVVELASTLGYLRYHTYRSSRSEPGWPDEALVRERLVLLELKTETGRLSQAQRDWLEQLDRAHVEVYVARPRHFDLLALILACQVHDGEFPPDERGVRAADAAYRLRDELRKELT